MEAPISFGAGVSLRLASDLGAFLASPGFADPRLVVRRRERPNFPLLQFDRCVFRFQFPPQTHGRRGKKPVADQRNVNSTHLTYGRTVCLVHAYSGLYVTVVRKPADGNASHFSVVLMSQEDAGSACKFRVMPRYKIRSEGDRVYDKDMIYLQQESSLLSLHGVASVNIGPEDAECTATENATSLEINLYDEAEQPDVERHPIIRAGCACLIFHREKDALLTVLSKDSTTARATPSGRSPTLNSKPALGPDAAGASKSGAAATQDLCFQHYDKPVANLSPEQLDYGCNALWFFENVDPTIGGTIEPHCPFRLRHGATGLYMSRTARTGSPTFGRAQSAERGAASGPDFCFTELSTIDALESTIFELEVVSSGGTSTSKIFSSKSFVRFRHRNTGSYLSSKTQSDGFSGGVVSSLVVEDHPNLEDTVTILMVPRKRQQELCYLIGNVEFLSSYIRMFYAMQEPTCQLRPQDPLVTRVVQRAAASLSALICFCTESEDDDPLTREGLPIANHQQSMFEVQLHCIVMDVLLCPFVSSTKENKMELPIEGGVLSIRNLLDDKLGHIHKVCRLCYRLLKQMSKGSPYAGQLVEYVSFMQAQEGYKLHVADTQLEIFTNNPNIPLDRCITNVKHFVNLLLTKERSSGYLRFLSSLCVVNGTGVPHNQQLVAKLLLQEHRDKILYSTRMEDGVLKVLVPPPSSKKKKSVELLPLVPDTAQKAATPTEATWQSLSEFLKKGEAKMIKFYESSIELLGNLCIGADASSLDLVRSLISQDHVTAAIDPRFECSDFLRSSYFTLALHLFVRSILNHRGSLTFSTNTCGALVRPLGVETQSPVAAPARSPADQGISALPASLAQKIFLENVKKQALVFIQQLRDSEAGTAGSDLVLVLSHIWHSIVMHSAYAHDELVEAVHAVIVCLDAANTANTPERYRRSEDTENAMRMKLGLCSFLRTVLEHETSRIVDVIVVELAKSQQSGGDDAVAIAEKLMEELKETFVQAKLLPSLMDLMFYENKQLVATAVELSLMLCNAPATIAACVRDAELVKPEALQSFNMFQKVHRELKRNFSVTGHVINEDALMTVVRDLTQFDPMEQESDCYASSPKKLSEAVDDDEGNDDDDASAMASLSARSHSAVTAARSHRSLSQIFRGKAFASVASTRLVDAVAEKRSRWRKSASKLEEYSRLLYRSGLHLTLTRVLQQETCGAELQRVIIEFFRILCIANESAKALGDYLPVFISFLRRPATQLDAASIILRVVEVNPWLSDKLESAVVLQLTQLLLQTKDPDIAAGLQHATLGEYPVARNQTLVLSTLVEAKVVDTFISDAQADRSANQMAMRSACVDLAASCCVNNMSCRSMISQIVGAGEVIALLQRSSLPPAHLVPYYKLLTSAFLSTEDDLTAQELQQRKRHWADDAGWWSLVEGRVFQLLTVEDDSPFDEDIVFLGVVPLLNSFYTHLYGPIQCSKSKVALPLWRVARKLCQFAEAFYRSKYFSTLGDEYRVTSLLQLIGSIAVHTDPKHESFNALKQMQSTLSDYIKTLSTKKSELHSTTNQLAGVEQFSRWNVNTEHTLMPLLDLWSGDQGGALHRCQAQGYQKFRRLHELLVQHIADGSLRDSGAIGVMSVLRLSIVRQDEGSPAFIEAQNYINSIGVLKMITETAFSSSADSSAEALQLAIAVCECGNKSVQDQLLAFFASTDERFFNETAASISYSNRRARQKRARESYLCFYSNSKTRTLTFGNLEANLRFLQLMCEGHHSGLQDYLREQQDNLRSVNVVKEIVRLLGELVFHEVQDSNFSLLVQILNALTEFCQGPCSGNQKLIVANGGCQFINAVLTWPTFAVAEPVESDTASRFLQLKRSAVTLLLALLEGNIDDSIATAILYDVSMSGLTALTKQLIETREFAEQTSEDVCEIVYNLMIVAHTLVNTTEANDRSDIVMMVEEAKQLLDKYSSSCGMLGRIEIERNDIVERVYFKVPPISALLSEETKQTLLWSLDRSTQGSKLSDFLDKIDEVIFDLEATHRVTQQMSHNKVFTFFAKWPLSQWDDVSLLIAIVMNLLFVVVMEDAQGLLDKHIDWFGVEGLIRLCAYAQAIVSIVIASMDGFLNFPLILYRQSKEIQQATLRQKVTAIVRRTETVYRLANVSFALMGFFFSDFFFAFHLLGLIGKSSVLKNVIVAVTTNGKSLLLTGMLGCILVYLFSIIAFVMFQDHFEHDACVTLNNCVLHILTSGLRQGGGIGDRMKEVNYGENMYLRRTIYDFLFWAIMIVIFLNILFGIIIDTFAELRDEKNKKEEDMRTKCLICGIDSYTFDRYGSGFHTHVKNEHNMWQYLYFLHHLRRKEPTEYTGQESYVSTCVAGGDISFFPAGKCLSLKDVHIGSTDDAHGEIGEDSANGDAGAAKSGKGSGSSAERRVDGSVDISRSGTDGLGASFSGGLALDASVHATLLSQSEQTVSTLARIIQRLDAMEKIAPSAQSSALGRYHRTESGIPARDTNASPAAKETYSRSQQQQLMEADHTYQLNLAHTKQDFELRQKRLYEGMSVAFELFQNFEHVALALWDAYHNAKVEMFASATTCQAMLMCHRINDLTRRITTSCDEPQDAQSNAPHIVNREEAQLRRMMDAVEKTATKSPSPYNRDGSPDPTVAASTTDMSVLMDQGRKYMSRLMQMTNDGRRAPVADTFAASLGRK